MSRPGRKKGQTRARMRAEKQSSYYAVCLVGFSDIVPRRLGDNMGAYPVTIVLAKKQGSASMNYDRGQPIHRMVTLEHALVPTEEHGKRLKASLLRALLGRAEAQGNDPSRHAFRDVIGCFDPKNKDERALWWAALLDDASQEVRRTIRGFKVKTAADKEAEILRYLNGGRA